MAKRMRDFAKEDDGWIYRNGTRHKPSADGCYRIRDFDLDYRSPNWQSVNSNVRTIRALAETRDFSHAKDHLLGPLGSSTEHFPSNFLKAMKFLFGVEGRIVDSKYDAGGLTNLGITHATYDAYRREHGLPVQSVTLIKKEEALNIYYENYWLPSQSGQHTYQLALVIFDLAVNSGVGTAKKKKNEASSKLGEHATDTEVTQEILKLRLKLYKDCCDISATTKSSLKIKHKLNRKNFVGWVNRLEKLCLEIGVEKFWTDAEIRNIIKGWNIHAKSTHKYDW